MFKVTKCLYIRPWLNFLDFFSNFIFSTKKYGFISTKNIVILVLSLFLTWVRDLYVSISFQNMFLVELRWFWKKSVFNPFLSTFCFFPMLQVLSYNSPRIPESTELKENRGIFKTQVDIYNGAFRWSWQDVRLGSKYTREERWCRTD